MVIRLDIPAETEARLRQLATAAGMDVESYAVDRLRQAVQRPNALADSLGPKAASPSDGWSEDELSDFIAAQIKRVRSAR